jgi:hypothetical protein
MAIGNASLALDLLNAATTYVALVASGASQTLEVGGVYTFCAMTSATTVGFGATSAAAITDGGAARGEPLAINVPPRIFICSSPAVSYVSGTGGSLLVRKCIL